MVRSVIFMVDRENIKLKIDTLPEKIIAKIDRIIKMETSDSDTVYLSSVPGFAEMLKKIDEDDEWLSEDEVNW